MRDLKLTPSQAQAVQARGGPVLVSAGAGSGKTRVLTERLIARVLEGEDITRFLVITFTRAAAAELRGRILTELNARAAADPADRRLRRQSALVYRAQIGTIDSFCTALVRENAHLLGLDPGFSVLDEDRAQAMRGRALEDVLDRAYETIDENEGLRLLVDSVGAGRDDSRLGALVLDLDEQMQSHAFPRKWAAEKLAALDTAGLTDAAQTPWGRYLLDDAAAEAAYRAAALDKAAALMNRPGSEPLAKSYGPAFSELAGLFRAVTRTAAESWDKTRQVLSWPVPRLNAVRGFPDEAAKARVKAVWDGAKKSLDKLRKDLAGDSAALLAGTAASRAPVTALMDLVWALQAEYAARKRRADACDFADVEHFCVRLLCDENGGPTALAKTVSGRFAEVMVDEYQDVNAIQELIFQRVSGEGRDLFMVGDVKQSIYRFRLAEPAIFHAKYEAFGAGAGQRILLRENFRSRASVLSACNGVFSRIMSPALGDVEYNEEAALIPGAVYPAEGEVKPELCILDGDAAAGGEDAPDKIRLEAQYVAGRIRAMVEDREMISDGAGGLRPVRYGDIALLLRTPGTTGAAFRRALAEAGVPVDARQGGAFFAQPEVSFTLSMLAVVDNPRQDVPLIAALRGLPFGFTPDELSAVRTAAKGDMWDALCARAEEDERCERFVSLVRELRSFAREEPTDSLIRRLYDRTELMTVCGVMVDAPRRTADLMQLYEYARRFEQGGGRGLFRFVSWLQELEKRGMEPPAPVGDDAVQLLSVHKSKGLEFPVVFLADQSHGWNTGSAHVLCHGRLGLGMRMTDTVRGVQWPTLPWRAIDQLTRREELSEQERVLYVAMTRARERLIITCVQPKAAEKLAACGGSGACPVDPRELLQARSPAAWLLAAAGGDGGETITTRIVGPGAAAARPEVRDRQRPAPDGDLTAEIGKRLAWRYPYETAVVLPSKLTATGAAEMAYAARDPDAAELPQRPAPVTDRLRRPDFGRGSRPLTGPERGVAAHLVMQHIDLARTGSERDIKDEITRMERLGFLDRRQAEAVDPADILAFFHSALGARLLGAERVIREFRFSLLCPAALWYPQAPAREQVLLQGVVDCCIQEDDALTVIDFKTDGQIEPGRYDGQIRAYAAAMERVYGSPVRQAALWYLRRREAVMVPLTEKK